MSELIPELQMHACVNDLYIPARIRFLKGANQVP